MPMTNLSPLLNKANVSLKPEEILLKKGGLIRFSDKYPKSGETAWASGRVFIVDADPVFMVVRYSNIIASGDWVNLDLTVEKMGPPPSPGVPHPTSSQQFAKQLYPVNPDIVYQIGVGMKPGSYLVLPYIPYGGNPINQLGSSAIIATVNDSVYRYFGAVYPNDSPHKAPTWFLYTIQGADQIVLQQYMDGGDTMDIVTSVLYGKATFEFQLNKCHLKEVTANNIAEVGLAGLSFQTIKERALYIPRFSELTNL